MGAFFSCPLAKYIDAKNGVESDSITVKFINFGDDEVKALERSCSSNSGDLKPTIIKSLEKMSSMETTDIPLREEELDVLANSPKSKDMVNQSPTPQSHDGIRTMTDLVPTNLEDTAAIELQKVYKSFRTRRRLADCAVLAEKSWWKLLNFADLRRSSISFFDIEKQKTAISRWSRARTRAARIDPRHRYGQNLQFYYDKWLHSQSEQPFFYWLDIGEGKGVDLVEECPRVKLQQQCIKYLGPLERTAYEVVVEDGKFIYKQSGELLHTMRVDKHEKWIFVLSTSKALYVGKKMKGKFHHSSFLAGGATLAAGRLALENGILQAVWPHSGHYRPTEENFHEFISFLAENNVDLTHVKMSPHDEEENELQMQKGNLHVRKDSSEEDGIQQLSGDSDDAVPEIVAAETIGGKSDFSEQETPSTIKTFKPSGSMDLSIKLTNLHTAENLEMRSVISASELDTEAREKNVLEEENRSCEVEIIPDESILKRINSHKETKSYQLGRQLSCKWTTGAGPRIGCVRDYPVELQHRALEKVSL
ncbi:IQ domain-containing protein IQM2-like isoform X2 [Benincasa hispida]|uniref:IQ domain-containing protein IQM2-like isoform X2 n=1 Tax=Benincasa hispida TaxID=102211 RepID=UPI0019020002|nr:IQ domain-containing protein IQM2-like isoform X2 [Benincasa hispida]